MVPPPVPHSDAVARALPRSPVGALSRVVLVGSTHHVQSDFSFALPLGLACLADLVPRLGYDAAGYNCVSNEICGAFSNGGWEELVKELKARTRCADKVQFCEQFQLFSFFVIDRTVYRAGEGAEDDTLDIA